MVGPWKVEWVEEIDSTNSQILRYSDVVDNMSVLAARFQSAGRGQRGNRWIVQKGVNLTFSIALRPGKDPVPDIKAAGQFPLSELSSLSVLSTLRDYGIPSSVKWPNDIYIGDRKVCGMLIENKISQDGGLGLCVVGIGLNVNQRSFDPSLMNPVSMASCPEGAGRVFDLEEVLGVLLGHYSRYLGMLASSPQGLHDEYVSKMYRLCEWHEYTDCRSGAPFEGKILGCTPQGLLRVLRRDGEELSFAFKEISYII